MTKQEFIRRMEIEKPLEGTGLSIEIDELIDSPYIIGCYEDNGVWRIYKTRERGGYFIIKELTNEDEAYEYLYKLVYVEKKISDHVKELGF